MDCKGSWFFLSFAVSVSLGPKRISVFSFALVFVSFGQACLDLQTQLYHPSDAQSSLSGKESAQGCLPKRLLGRPDYIVG